MNLMLNKSSKIYIAGHSGMVGSSLIKILKEQGYKNLIYESHSNLDLINQKDVAKFFKKNRPDIVFILAAKVGGIAANNHYRANFIYENLMIQTNIIHNAHLNNVKKLIFFGSACIYPKYSNQPIKESELLTGLLEPTNEPYAIAKIAGIKLCQSYYQQYNNNFISLMPNNLYGPKDNFDLKTSHVLPALLKKISFAKKNNIDNVEIWGTGKPLREFLFVDDLAKAAVFVLEKVDTKALLRKGISHINVGSGQELSIKELALLIKKVVQYKGGLVFNKNMPDGTPRKFLDISLICELGWKPEIELEDGIKKVYSWFLKNKINALY